MPDNPAEVSIKHASTRTPGRFVRSEPTSVALLLPEEPANPATVPAVLCVDRSKPARVGD